MIYDLQSMKELDRQSIILACSNSYHYMKPRIRQHIQLIFIQYTIRCSMGVLCLKIYRLYQQQNGYQELRLVCLMIVEVLKVVWGQ